MAKKWKMPTTVPKISKSEHPSNKPAAIKPNSTAQCHTAEQGGQKSTSISSLSATIALGSQVASWSQECHSSMACQVLRKNMSSSTLSGLREIRLLVTMLPALENSPLGLRLGCGDGEHSSSELGQM